MDYRKWLLPGMGIKRWIAFIVVGTILCSLGITIILNTKFLSIIELVILNTSEMFPNRQWILGIFIIGLGIYCVFIGMKYIIRSIVETVSPKEIDNLFDAIYKKRSLQKGPRIVVIGGGTGLSTLLRGLKLYSSNITAIVTVADDGGSSGKIRSELGILPPGDIRNTLVALADTEPLMERLFQYRFSWGDGLQGHSFGNLFIAAMTDITGDFEAAIREFSKVLAVGGIVLPSTLETVRLKATYTDGSQIIGESQIPHEGRTIERIDLMPKNIEPLPEALKAIDCADLIVLGPGSLYTSIIPNLLVDKIRIALTTSVALKVYVCNVMTQPGETDNMSAADHIQSIFKHCQQKRVFDYVLLNNARLTQRQAKKYKNQNSYPIRLDLERIKQLGVEPICAPLLDRDGLARHDAASLARELIKLVLERW